MDENHLEPTVDTPESVCWSLCDKIMKNMVLTLTILGKFINLLFQSHVQGSCPGFPSMHCSNTLDPNYLFYVRVLRLWVEPGKLSDTLHMSYCNNSFA